MSGLSRFLEIERMGGEKLKFVKTTDLVDATMRLNER